MIYQGNELEVMKSWTRVRLYHLYKAREFQKCDGSGVTTVPQRLAVVDSWKSEIRDCEMWEVRGRAVYNDKGQ